MRLQGKTIVVTAAGQGIGRACTLAMAREGATVWATDLNPALLAAYAGVPGIRTAELNVLSTEDVSAFAARTGDVPGGVSAADSSGTLPNPKQIGGVPAAIHDATSASASVGDCNAKAPTNGRRSIHCAQSARGPGTSSSS